MPTFSIPNVRLAGVSLAVPPLREIHAGDLPLAERQRDAVCGINATTVVRQADREKTQADFCAQAAKQLLFDLGWSIDEVEIFVMATLTPDYPIPATAFIIHEMLGVNKSSVVFDILAGPIGLLQGIQSVASMLSNGHLKKGLLFTGAVPKHRTTELDTLNLSIKHQILGDCGAVLAFQHDPSAEPIHLDLEGNGAKSMLMAQCVGGSRHPMSPELLEKENPYPLTMDEARYNQMARQVLPKSLERVLAHGGKTVGDIDRAYLSPLDTFTEDHLRRTLGLPMERFRSMVFEFGIRNSGSIPAAMIAHDTTFLRNEKARLLMAAFDSGLSWGSALVTTERLVCSEIIEF